MMKKNTPIALRKALKFSNPSKSEVVEADYDLNSYIREISAFPTLSSKEERVLAKLAKEGNAEAKQKLIQSNLKLVITIAKKAIHKSDLPMIDLIQEGNVGLMVAADKFNYKLGYKFATYAAWWIKQSMFKAISEQSHCMKIPVYIQETLSKFSKIKSEMERLENKIIKTEDVAKIMNMSPDKLDTFLSAYTKTISIESGLENADGKEMNVADILPDEKTSVSESAEFEELKNDIDMVVATLKDRERDVVRMRYGLGNSARMTLEEIGNIYGVTKECIRQTELRALKKMKVTGHALLFNYIS